MLLFLLACFQVDEEEWTEWEETYSDPANTNTAPEISEAIISPETEIYNDSTLTCSATGTDVEDGDLTVEYAWLIEEAQVTVGATINLGLYPTVTPNQEVTCVATAVDGFGVEASSEISIIIENRNPIIDDIGLTDIEPFANATLSCSATATDEDEEADNLSISYVWDIDGDEVGTEAEITLTPEIAPVGATLTCTATATDSQEGTGSEVTTGTIRNTPPEITEVNITPETGVDTLSTLTCSIVGSDLNDSDLVPSFVWTNGPTEIGQGEEITLTSSLAQPNETLTCTATLEDNNEASATDSTSVIVGNAPPVFATPATITPNTGVFTGTQVQCSAVVTDSEDFSILPTYDWKVNGTTVFSGEFYTVLAEHIDVGQSLECVATVVDAHSAMETSSTSVLIENTAPVVNSVQIVPQQPEADDEVECTHDITDIDEETLNITYSWDLQGATVGSNATLDLSTLSPAVGESLTCTVSVSDGAGDTDSSFDLQLIENSPAEFLTGPTITPDVDITVDSFLTCSATGTDINDGSITPTYEWFNGSISIGTGNTIQLDNSLAAPNDTIGCQATLVDSHSYIVESSTSVTVFNAPPVFDTPAVISPNTGVFTGTQLICSASASDAEDGSITPSYAWEVNGNPIGFGLTYTVLAGDTDVGDNVFCTASVTDAHGTTETSSVSVTIENTLPSISNVQISPAPVYNDSVVNCSATLTDPDEILTGNFVWTSNGHEIAQGNSLNLTSVTLLPGNMLSCEVDTEDLEGAIASDFAEITIENRSPSAPIISILGTIDSTTASNVDDLTCTASGSVDPDGEQVTYSFEWNSDNGGLVSGAVLSAGDTSIGESWTCEAFASDPNGATTRSTTDIEIVNSIPEVSNVSISPAPAYNSDILTCLATVFDADETLTPEYVWMDSSDTTLGISQTLNLTAVFVPSNETLTCTVSVQDSYGVSAADSADITLTNRAPSQPNVLISSSVSFGRATTVDTLSCAASGSVDPDGDNVSYTYEWTSDVGAVVSGATVLAAQTTKGETWTCTVTAEDPHGAFATAADDREIENTVAEIQSIDISPNPMYNDSTATCIAVVYDPDESLTPIYNWWYGSLQLGSGDTIDLSQHNLWSGSELQCVVDVQEPDYGIIQDEAGIYFTNRAPSAPDVSITWNSLGYLANPADNLDLTCTASGSVDPDGDAVNYSYSWSGGSGGTVVDGQVLLSSNTSDGDSWTCTAIASDGTDSATGVAAATVANLEWSKCSSAMYMSQADYSFVGIDAGDSVGEVSPAGDIDGDGLEDFVIGTPDAWGDNTTAGTDDGYAGEIYVILGSSLSDTSSISLSNADYLLYSEYGQEHAGYSIAGGGDLDGDGKGDLVIAAPRNSENGQFAGKVYIFLGSSFGSNTSMGLNSADFIIEGTAAGDWVGEDVAFAGDVDNDGKDDLLVGTLDDNPNGTDSGTVYLFYGSSLAAAYSSAGTVNFPLTSANLSFFGENNSDQASKVAAAGDVNGDGRDDFMIGAPYHSGNGYSQAGKVYVVYGNTLSSYGGGASINLPASAHTVTGVSNYEYLGYSMASGDFDADGLTDLAIGAYNDDIGGNNAGAVRIFMATMVNSNTNQTATQAGTTIVGEAADDEAGYSVAFAGDIDNDNRDDLIIGARYNSTSNYGKAYVVLGYSIQTSHLMLGSDSDYRIVGDTYDDQAGAHVNRAGDVNGDGVEDLLISAQNFDNGFISSSNYGKVSLFLGCD